MKIMTALKLTVKTFLQNDEQSRYLLAERISGLIYPKFKFSDYGRIFLEDKEFFRFYESYEGNNYHSLDRKYALNQLMKLVEHIDGDTAECGVFKGASSFLICRNIAGQKKKHHLFDSFEGLSDPGGEDGRYWTRGDLRCLEDEAQQSLKDFDFVFFHKGWIPSKFSDVQKTRFSFVHLDVDLYQPTLDSLIFFYDRLNPGALLICDDYGFCTCPGARKAMDSFLSDKPEKVVCLPTGQAFIQKISS